MIIQIEIPNDQMKTIHQLAQDCHVESEDIIRNIISEWHEEHFPRGQPKSQTLRLEPLPIPISQHLVLLNKSLNDIGD